MNGVPINLTLMTSVHKSLRAVHVWYLRHVCGGRHAHTCGSLRLSAGLPQRHSILLTEAGSLSWTQSVMMDYSSDCQDYRRAPRLPATHFHGCLGFKFHPHTVQQALYSALLSPAPEIYNFISEWSSNSYITKQYCGFSQQSRNVRLTWGLSSCFEVHFLSVPAPGEQLPSLETHFSGI